MKAIDGQLPCVATTPPTILTLLPKFTVPHAAWFCFILIELLIKKCSKIINQKFFFQKTNLKSRLHLVLQLLEKFYKKEWQLI
jgi:hypothetical protein